jgi:hypothetical protein
MISTSVVLLGFWFHRKLTSSHANSYCSLLRIPGGQNEKVVHVDSPVANVGIVSSWNVQSSHAMDFPVVYSSCGNPTSGRTLIPHPDQSRFFRSRGILFESRQSKSTINVMPVGALEFRADETSLVFGHVSVPGELSDDGHERVEIGTREFSSFNTAGGTSVPSI